MSSAKVTFETSTNTRDHLEDLFSDEELFKSTAIHCSKTPLKDLNEKAFREYNADHYYRHGCYFDTRRDRWCKWNE